MYQNSCFDIVNHFFTKNIFLFNKKEKMLRTGHWYVRDKLNKTPPNLNFHLVKNIFIYHRMILRTSCIIDKNHTKKYHF